MLSREQYLQNVIDLRENLLTTQMLMNAKEATHGQAGYWLRTAINHLDAEINAIKTGEYPTLKG